MADEVAAERPGWLPRLFAQLLRIRTRLLVINLVILFVPVVGLEWARSYEREMLRALERDMRHQADLLRTLLAHHVDAKSGKVDFKVVAPALRDAAKRTRSRIRLLDRRGVLVADSHKKGPPEGPEPAVRRIWGYGRRVERRHPGRTATGPLLGRREIRAARAGRLGTATRVHRRIQRVYLFVALPIMTKRRVRGIVYITRSTVPVLQSLYRLRRTLYGILGAALAATVLLSLFLAWTISRPLGRLTRTAKRIADGDRSVSLAGSSRVDEIGELDRAFAEMVRQLDTRAQYISEMAANISHEFKTPLTSIRGAAELLEDAGDDEAVRARFLGNILADTQRLDRLVSRILELSRIEATLEQRAPFDLAELVREVGQQFASSHDCQVVVAGANQRLPFTGNRPHLRAAMVALVENAVRVSPSDGVVRIDLARAGGDVARGDAETMKAGKPGETAGATLSVSDLGPGISEANQKKIFDRFFTTDAERGGSGLGLAIVQTVARAHGGSVSVKSVVGEGSTFSIALPG